MIFGRVFHKRGQRTPRGRAKSGWISINQGMTSFKILYEQTFMELTLTVICPEILVNPMVRDVNLNINAVIPCLMTEIVTLYVSVVTSAHVFSNLLHLP